jgi:DNA-binding transcriptional LysR family regulator
MARADQFNGLAAFLAVAERASFRAAAADLGVTRAAVSLGVQTLERRLGQPLFLRTTRSVALTDAGQQLLASVGPASAQILRGFEEVGGHGGSPVGTLRLSAPRIALELVLAPVLPAFRKAYPGVEVELDIDDTSVALAVKRYDAGIRIGEFIERDMVAVRLTPDFQWVVAGAPDYFARHGKPQMPQDLLQHECVRYRFPTAGAVYRWEFQAGEADFTIEPPGGITVTDHLSMVEFARRGLGLAYTADLVAARWLQSGELVAVLDSYLPAKQGLFLYFPANAQKQPKLRAFIDTAKAVLGTRRL